MVLLQLHVSDSTMLYYFQWMNMNYMMVLLYVHFLEMVYYFIMYVFGNLMVWISLSFLIVYERMGVSGSICIGWVFGKYGCCQWGILCLACSWGELVGWTELKSGCRKNQLDGFGCRGFLVFIGCGWKITFFGVRGVVWWCKELKKIATGCIIIAFNITKIVIV